MATVSECCAVEQIGALAGVIWHLLDANGPMSPSQLVKRIDAPRDTVNQALGWLAREDKLVIEETSRGRVISLLSID